MLNVLVTLIYADGTHWFAGQFPSQAAADAWIAEEQTRPYWVDTTQVQQTQITLVENGI